MEKVLFHMGQTHLRSGNDVEARLYMDKLLTDYPDGEYVNQAQEALATVGGTFNTDIFSN